MDNQPLLDATKPQTEILSDYEWGCIQGLVRNAEISGHIVDFAIARNFVQRLMRTYATSVLEAHKSKITQANF